MAVSHHDATPLTSGNSYTTPVDATEQVNQLVEFLTARLDEDERVAERSRNRIKPLDLAPNGDFERGVWAHTGDGYIEGYRLIIYPEGHNEDDAEHIARWDPKRVLAEVSAKRQIIAEHALMSRNIGWLNEDREEMYEELEVCALCTPKHSHFKSRAEVSIGPCPTLRLLALPYADHPDYWNEWRP